MLTIHPTSSSYYVEGNWKLLIFETVGKSRHKARSWSPLTQTQPTQISQEASETVKSSGSAPGQNQGGAQIKKSIVYPFERKVNGKAQCKVCGKFRSVVGGQTKRHLEASWAEAQRGVGEPEEHKLSEAATNCWVLSNGSKRKRDCDIAVAEMIGPPAHVCGEGRTLCQACDSTGQEVSTAKLRSKLIPELYERVQSKLKTSLNRLTVWHLRQTCGHL